ncbi:MAG: hypothetical protein MUF62_10295, partial [Chitinophagaceae bacterium]|nr:hypothetical protein [Chitinophagaceae bacterium]
MRNTARCMVLCLAVMFAVGCKKTVEEPAPVANFYQPPIGSSTWETTTPESLGWNAAAIPGLYSFLQSTNTRAFLVLKNGRIVLEQYFGNQITGGGAFGANSVWYWASAGKTLTAS